MPDTAADDVSPLDAGPGDAGAVGPICSWLHVFGPAGSRLSAGAAVAGASAPGGTLAVGTTPSTAKGGYDAWVVTTDALGKQLSATGSGVVGFDDRVALATHPAGGAAVAGMVAGTPTVQRLDGAGKALWTVTAPKTALDNALGVAAAADGAVFACGMRDLNSKTGEGWAAGWSAAGKPLIKGGWSWSRGVPGRRVSANHVVAGTSGAKVRVALLGYDRLLPPGGSGADLYTMWVVALDASGGQLWERTLAKDITGAASGLVARATGDFITLLDAPAGLVLSRVSATGQASPFATLPGGLIATASDLAPAPQGGVFVVRDATSGPLQIIQLDSKGGTVAKTTLAWPKTVGGRVFGASWLGDSALLLSGQLTQKVSGSSSTAYRAFMWRLDLWPNASCPAGNACLGAEEACVPDAGCAGTLCSGETGCFSVGCAP